MKAKAVRPSDLVTAEEVARITKLKLSTIRALTSQRRIPHFKLGRSVRYDPAEILELFEKREITQ
jgi:excisionase family DNA binding protein